MADLYEEVRIRFRGHGFYSLILYHVTALKICSRLTSANGYKLSLTSGKDKQDIGALHLESLIVSPTFLSAAP